MKILFVCTGNICRSPMAAGMLKHMLYTEGQHKQHQVDSAGTHALINYAPDPMARAVMLEQGIDISQSRARQLKRDDVLKSDLVLLADNYNRHYLQSLLQPGEDKFVQMFLDYHPAYVNGNLPDPYGEGREQFYQVLQLIRETCGYLVEKLARE